MSRLVIRIVKNKRNYGHLYLNRSLYHVDSNDTNKYGYLNRKLFHFQKTKKFSIISKNNNNNKKKTKKKKENNKNKTIESKEILPIHQYPNLNKNISTHDNLIQLLNENNIKYQHMIHEAARTSQEAAEIRGTSLASGAKAMLLYNPKQQEHPFYLFVMSASCLFDWKKVRKQYGKKLKFASEEQVYDIAKCLPGGVPPFGSLFDPPAYTIVDLSLFEQGDVISFNAGDRTKSVIMNCTDYCNIEKPIITNFIK